MTSYDKPQLRLTQLCLAASLFCLLLPAAQADEGDAPLGIDRAVTLPAVVSR